MAVHAGTFNWRDNTLSFTDCHRASSTTHPRHQNVGTIHAKVVKKTIFQPSETKNVDVYPTSSILAKTLIFESNEYLLSQGLSAHSQAVDGTIDYVSIVITNMSDSKKVLYPNRKIGIFYKPQSLLTSAVFSDESNPPVGEPLSGNEEVVQEPLVHNVCEENFLPEDVKLVTDFLATQRDVFAATEAELGVAKSLQFEITLTSNIPFKARPYRTNPDTKKKIDAHIEELLAAGSVQHSKSTYSSPCLLVPKKGGLSRLVVDFRTLNKISVTDNYPMVHMEDLLSRLGGAKIFSCLDCRSGYNQIAVHPNSRHLTAFVTEGYLVEYLKMPFGHKNSAPTFCRLMEHTLRGLTDKFVTIFVDDICVHSPDLKTHLEHLKIVFERLRNENIKLKPEKCEFLKKEIAYLGSIISAMVLNQIQKKLVL